MGLLKCSAESPLSCCDALADYAWNLESFFPSSSVGLLQLPSKTYAFCAMLWWIMHEINTNVLPTLIQLLLFLFFHLSISPFHFYSISLLTEKIIPQLSWHILLSLLWYTRPWENLSERFVWPNCCIEYHLLCALQLNAWSHSSMEHGSWCRGHNYVENVNIVRVSWPFINCF